MSKTEHPCGCWADEYADHYCATHWEPLRIWMQEPTEAPCDCGHDGMARHWHTVRCPAGETVGDLMRRLGLEQSPIA